eukprot:SAG31_NODE_2092_length_6464_cov_3.597172_10_plen_55_part_00
MLHFINDAETASCLSILWFLSPEYPQFCGCVNKRTVEVYSVKRLDCYVIGIPKC